jgi:hypothetical protein
MTIGRQGSSVCIKVLVTNADLRKNEEAEPLVAAVWAAISVLARSSQASVSDWAGLFVRLETVRMENRQTKFQVMQESMDNVVIYPTC